MKNDNTVNTETIGGAKTYICDALGKYYINPKVGKPGERVKMGNKLYEITKCGSLKRIDKQRSSK